MGARHGLFAAASMLGACAAFPAMAQGNVAQVEELVVTAQHRAENLSKVPLSISAFSGETLAARGVSNVQDLQTLTPGAVVNNTGPISAPFIRGVGTRLTNGGLEPSIATYFDDRYIANPKFTNRALADVERVEVLKGPQGTLYGRNATGGAIRIITRDVGSDLGGYVDASYGNYNYMDLQAAANIPLNDALGVRVYGLDRQRDGIAKNLVGGTALSALNDIDERSIGAKAKWRITDAATLRFGGSYWSKKDSQGTALVDVSPPGLSLSLAKGGLTGTSPESVATAITQPSSGREYSGFVDFDYALPGANFTSLTNFDNQKYFLSFDGDGTSLRSVDIYTYERADSFQQEFRLASKDAGVFTWLVGAYGYYYKIDFSTAIDVGAPTFIDSSGEQVVRTYAGALFGQAKWAFTDRLSLTLGGRYSTEKKKVRNFPTPPSTLFPNLATPAALRAVLPYDDQHTWTKFTPKVTVEYDLGPSMFYATYASGFKSGGYNPPAATSPRLNPETLDMVEVGSKGVIERWRFRYDASVYHYKYKDLQVSRSVDGTIAIVQNAANAKLTGFDLDADWAPTSHLTFSGGVSFVDSEYVDFNAAVRKFAPGPGTVSAAFDAAGSPLLRAPRWSGFFSAHYVMDAPGGTAPIDLSYAFKSSFLFDFVTQPQVSAARQPAYGVLNGQISYAPRSGGWLFSVWAKNLTDERYFNDVTLIAAGIRGSYADPRTFGVRVRRDF